MLKSTYRPQSWPEQLSLPSPWTEHVAPTGHKYYYNPETKQSTYNRPALQNDSSQCMSHSSTADPSLSSNPLRGQSWHRDVAQGRPIQNPNVVRPASGLQHNSAGLRGGNREDRPKSKHAIPGCVPWLLIKTKLGRRFVHNPITEESFWKFPKNVVAGVVEFDIQERQKHRLSDAYGASGTVATPTVDEERPASSDIDVQGLNKARMVTTALSSDQRANDGDEEYEEVEVTDSESGDNADQAKRLKLGDEPEATTPVVEFGEDDIARQLDEMGQLYQLDPGEYGNPEPDGNGDAWEEGAEGLDLTEEEATASFKDLLRDYKVDPYTTWEAIVSAGYIIDDERYTLLLSMKKRKEAFTAWSVARIQQHKLEKEKQVQQDPQIPYLAFLANHATPKLFWPEFKRKYRKEPELKDSKLSDKDREALYRHHITRITKQSEESLKHDLRTLLQSVPVSASWNRSTTLGCDLPPAILADVRFISLKPAARESEIQAYISNLPSFNEIKSSSNLAEVAQANREQRQQELAIDRRRREVEEGKLHQKRELQRGQRRLMEEERELSRAMTFGKEGLMDHVKSSTMS